MPRIASGPTGIPERAPYPARRTTLRDIARIAGVHVTTVSQILNNKSNCWASAATRRRVRAIAAQLGYRPNLAARSLRSGRSRVIGYITPGFGAGSPYSRPIGLTAAAFERDYTVIVSSHPNDSASEDHLIRRLLDRSVDGLAVYPADTGPHRELRRLAASGFPLVTLNGAALLDFACDDVSPDYEAVGRLQVQHAFQIGRRCVCLLRTEPEARINILRNKAIRAHIAEAGLPPPVEICVTIPRTADEFVDPLVLETGMRTAIRACRKPFDVAIGHDTLASLAIRTLAGAGYRIPDDVAVIGAGNTSLALYGMIPMTSVSTDDDAAGAVAFRLLLDRIEGRGQPPGYRRQISTAHLIPRVSSIGQPSPSRAP